tara:strand:- start:716 stop:928 length:213 start_codon:yes stop_codon:yes gene_type:complete
MFSLSWVLLFTLDIGVNRSLENIDFALVLAKVTMDINTINYFIAISASKFIVRNLPFGFAQTLSQNKPVY